MKVVRGETPIDTVFSGGVALLGETVLQGTNGSGMFLSSYHRIWCTAFAVVVVQIPVTKEFSWKEFWHPKGLPVRRPGNY